MQHRNTRPVPDNEINHKWSAGNGLTDPAASPLRALAARFPGGAAHVSGPHLWLNTHAEAMVGYHNHDLGTLDAWGRTVYREHDPRSTGDLPEGPGGRVSLPRDPDHHQTRRRRTPDRVQRLPRRRRGVVGDA